MMETAYLSALRIAGEFPRDSATILHGSLAWDSAMREMLAARPSDLNLIMSRQTCRLLPELCPVDAADGEATWLDRVLPVYRSLHHIPRFPAPRQREMSLAILYQENGLLKTIATDAERELRGSFDSVNLYPGSLVADSARRLNQLQEIFFRHRAVLFLGHLHSPGPTNAGGWQLTDAPDDFLPLAEVEALLRGVSETMLPAKKKGQSTLSIPELVFTGCCSGAWGAPVRGGPNEYFYPELFLDNGVRFFVGSWMDIVFPTRQLIDLRLLFTGFLVRWSRNPAEAPRALFEAKLECRNPLLASLLQLYVAPEPSEPLAEPEARPAMAPPLTAGLESGVYLGPYLLVRNLWNDPWATGFWAYRADNRSSHIIQVLADAWQDDPRTLVSIESALEELHQAKLPDSHLVPARLERLAVGDSDSAGPALLVLVYDRPPGETDSTWSRLMDRKHDPNEAEHFQRVLELGAEVGVRLWEMHNRKILHGNFDPAAVVFRQADGRSEVVIKDAWVRWVQPGRCTHPRYAAPDAQSAQDAFSRFKVDCYGLGVLLFELAAGHPRDAETSVRAAAGDRASFVPEALDRVVRGCLAPSASVRPSAEEVALRLTLARHSGGTYLSDLGQEFDIHIAAGHRLFVARVDRVEDLQRVLEAMQANPTTRCRYHLYMAAEHEGVVDCRLRQTVIPWMAAAELRTAIAHQTGSDPGPVQPAVEAFVNASGLFDWIGAMSASPSKTSADPRPEMPVVLIRGAQWWQAPQFDELLRSYRILKACQQERGYPVIVIADTYLTPIGDSTLPFQFLDFPAPTPSELFERVLSAPEALKCQSLNPEQAADIADQLFPCTIRELEESLKLCAIRYSCIDHHVVDIRDEDRARRFRSLGTLSYTPAARLQAFDEFGWPPLVEPAVRAWVQAVRDNGVGPRRLLITGPSGYGKTAAPRSLAQGLRLPLFRLDASSCLQKNLGDSEQMLAMSLEIVETLGGAVLVIDDLDKFIPPIAPAAAMDPTILRMSAILSNWIDRLPPRVILIATVKAPEALSGGWLRRFEMTIPLGAPALHLALPDSLDYRQAVLASLFRRFRLPAHAENRGFLNTMAEQTCPTTRLAPLPDAVARLRPSGTLGGFVVSLRTGADIEAWMAETLLLHTPSGDPAAPESEVFWLNAVR
jgi:hypothetical protein